MDDVFVYHECQSTRWSHSAKNINKQTQPQTTFFTCLLLCLFDFSCAFYYVCLIFHVPFLTFCLVVCLFFSCAFPTRFVNCIKRAVFTKAPIFPAYSTNIVIVIFNKWPPLLNDLGHPFAANGLPFLSFLPVLTSGHP